MGYEWDLFISYPRRQPIGPWVADRFVPILEKWLGAALPHVPKIFVDNSMESGTHWPTNLAESLLRSKQMIAIWAPPYFGSGWCMSEWENMRAREDLLGRGHGSAAGLVHVLRFFDGATFPAAAQAIQTDDYTPFNKFPPGKGILKSKLFQTFETKIQDLSERLAQRILTAPPWDENWPVLRSPDPRFDTTLTFEHVSLRGQP